MTIIEPSDNQDERSPLKKDVEINTTISSAALATAPPPYTSFPTSSPNPIPSSQAIPQNDDGPQPHRVILSHRPSPIRRFLAAFLVAWLVLFLWSAFVHSFNNVRHVTLIGNSHSHEYEVVRLDFFMLLS